MFSTMECARMRKLFNKIIAKLYDKRRPQRYEWRKKEWIQNTIEFLDKFDIRNWTSDEYTLSQTYEVAERDGKKILKIKKLTDVGVDKLEMIPVEDYYEAIYEAHIETKHAGRRKMMEYFKRKDIYMPSEPVSWFSKFCKVCQARKLAPSKRCVRGTARTAYNHGLVELINMSKTPDGNYKYIMHYRDMTTNFMFLKPLRTPQVTEVAEELLKLILEIGIPGIIHTPANISFTEALIEKISSTLPGYLIVVGNQMQPMNKTDGIERKLRTWMKVNKSTNWAKGIFFVANMMNLTKSERKHREAITPYIALLGLNPQRGLNPYGLKSVLKKLKYEEDLEKITYLVNSDKSCETEEDEDELDYLQEDNCNVKDERRLDKFSDDARNKMFDQHFTSPRKLHKQTLMDHLLNTSELTKQSANFPVKPVKMYTKKPKPDKASSSQEFSDNSQELDSQMELVVKKSNISDLTYQNSNIKGKLSNFKQNLSQPKSENIIQYRANKPIKKVEKSQISKNTNALCVNESLRELSDYSSLTRQQQKNITELWNSNNIDLPANSSSNLIDKDTRESQERRSLRYSYACTMRERAKDHKNVKCKNLINVGFGENLNLNSAVLYKTDEPKNKDIVCTDIVHEPTFGKIIKIESLCDSVKNEPSESNTSCSDDPMIIIHTSNVGDPKMSGDLVGDRFSNGSIVMNQEKMKRIKTVSIKPSKKQSKIKDNTISKRKPRQKTSAGQKNTKQVLYNPQDLKNLLKCDQICTGSNIPVAPGTSKTQTNVFEEDESLLNLRLASGEINAIKIDEADSNTSKKKSKQNVKSTKNKTQSKPKKTFTQVKSSVKRNKETSLNQSEECNNLIDSTKIPKQVVAVQQLIKLIEIENIIQTRSKSKRKLIKTASKQNIPRKRQLIDEPKTICIDKNIRELSDNTRKGIKTQKRFQSWNTGDIDLPSESDDGKCVQPATAFIKMENNTDFGKLSYVESPDLRELTAHTTEEAHLSAPADIKMEVIEIEVPLLETIVKTEPIAEDND